MTSCQQDPPFLSIGAHVVIQVENNEKDIKNNKNKTNGKTEKKDLNNNIQLEDSDVDEINNNKSDAYAEISGTLRFIGSVHFRKGIWCGVELEEEKGLNDGSVGGHKYFVCPPQKGVFAPLHKVKAFRPKSEFKGRYHGVLFDCPFEGSFSRTSQPSKSPSLVNFANEFKSRIPIATSADALASKCIFLPENIYLKTANNAENLNVEESAMKRWNIKPQQTSVETLPNNVKKKNLKSRLPVPKRKTKLKDVRKNFLGQSVRRQGKKKVSFKLTPEISEFSQHPLSGLVKRNNKKKSFKKPHKTSLVSTIATDSFETSACNEGSRKTKLKLKLKIPKAGIWLSSDEKAEMGGDDKRTELCGNDGMAKMGRDDVMAEIGGDNEMSEIKTPGSAEIDQLINQSKHLFSKRTKINPLHTSLLSTTNQKFLTFNKHKNKKENIKLSKKTGSEQKFLSKPSLHLAKTVILQYAELLKNSQDGLAAHQKKLAVSKIYDSSDLHNIKNLQQRDSFLKMKEDPLPISSPHHKMKRSDGLFEHSPVKHSVHSTHNTRVSVEIPTNEVEEKNSDSSNDFEVFEGEDLVASSESNFKISPILLSQFDKPLFPDNPAWLSRSFSSCNSDGSIGNVFEELERVLEGGRVLKKWLELSMESIGENEEQHNTIEVGASICVKRGGVELEELGDVKKRNDGFEVEDLGEAKKRYGGLKLEEVSDVIRKDDGSKVEKWDSGIKRDEKKECRMSLISSGSCDTGCAMDFDVSMFETSVLCWSNNGDQINTNDDKPVCGNIDSHSDINENQETNETNKAHNYFMGTSLDLVGNEELLSDVRSSLIPLDMLESGYGEDEGSVEGKVKECNGVGGQSLENESFCLRDVEISLETMCVVESHNNTNNNNNNEKNNNNQNDINNNNNITNKNINDNKNNNDNIGNKDNVINNNNNKVNSNNKNDNEDNDNKNKNNKNIEKEESGEDGVAELKKSDKAKIININKNFEKAKSKFENNKIDKNNVIKNISEKEKLVANENKSSRNVKIEKIILANKNSKEKQQEKGLKNSGKNEVGSSQEKLKTPKNDVKTLIEKTSLNKSIKSIAKQSTVLNKSVQNKPNVSNKRVSETPVKVSNDPRKTDKEKKTKLSPARSKTQIKPPVSQNKTLLLQNKTSSLHHKASLPPKKISLPFNKPPLPKSHTYLQHHRNNALDKKLNDSTRNNIKRSSTFSDKENVVENIKKLSIGGRMSASYDEKNRKGVEGGKKDTRKMSIMVLSESNHSIELTKKDEEFKEIKEKAAKEHDERLKNLEKTFEKKIECLKQEMQAKHEERILTLTRQHDEELKTLELNLKNKYRILLDTMLEENNIRSSEAHLKFQQSIQELTQKFEGENGKLQDQLKSLTQKHESSVTLLKHKLATVERREKELKDHLKLKEKEQKQCQLEVESLTIVLEEKNKEVKSMREQVSLLQQKTEEMPGLREELKRHQHHIEELQSVLDIKTNNEKRLMEEKDEWMMRKEVESQQVMRLSMDNEQLLWRLSTLSPPTSSNVPPNFDLSTSPSNKTAPSNNSFHRFSHNFEPSSDSTLILKTPKSRMSAGL